MATHLKFLVIMTAAVLLGAVAQADDAAGSAEDYSFHLGTLLPNQIAGVTDILPVWGLRYAYPIGFASAEADFSNTHAHGVDFTTVGARLRAELNSVEGFTNLFYAGLDMNAFRPVGATSRIWMGGAHVGTGLMMHVASTFWLRADMKFAVSPGTSLYLGFGFVIRPGSGSGGT